MKEENNQELEALTETEELELKELELKTKKTSILKYILAGSALLLTLLLVYGSLLLAPLNFKIAGEWTDKESGTYTLTNNGSHSEFRINHLQDNPNLTLLIKGELYAAGSNRYKTKDNQPYLEVKKEQLSSEVIEDLKGNTEVYEVEKETESILLLKYTSAAVEATFPDKQLESLFYYELAPDYLFGDKGQLKLRNSTFADPTVMFEH